jgi:hypothetical protein
LNREILPSRRRGTRTTRTNHVGQPPSAVKTTEYRLLTTENCSLTTERAPKRGIMRLGTQAQPAPAEAGGGHGDKETADTLAPAKAGVYADEHGPRPIRLRSEPALSTAEGASSAGGTEAFSALRVPAGRSCREPSGKVLHGLPRVPVSLPETQVLLFSLALPRKKPATVPSTGSEPVGNRAKDLAGQRLAHRGRRDSF